MPIITYQNRPLFYQVQGEGFPLVLLHGFCEDHSVWNDLVDHLKDLQIIRIDLPGFGQSAPAVKGDIEQMAGAVKSVLDVLEIESCILLGHSMGGYVTLSFAEHFPNYLLGFGLVHSHPYADEEATKVAREKSREFIQQNGPIYYVKQLIPKLFPPAFLSSKRYISDRLIFQASQFPAEGIRNGLEAMKERPDRSEVLRQSKVPVLFILGEKDELIPFERQVEQSHFPSIATVHILPRVGHMGLLEAPKKTAKFIQDFCHFCIENTD